MKLQNAQGMLEGQKKTKFQYAQPYLSKKISSSNGMSPNSGPRSQKLEHMSLRKLQLISNYSSNRHHHPDQQAVNENNVLATSIIYIYYIDFSYVSSRVWILKIYCTLHNSCVKEVFYAVYQYKFLMICNKNLSLTFSTFHRHCLAYYIYELSNQIYVFEM